MRNLEEIRLEINEIDEKLIKLFTQRMECAREVGLYKKENNIPILNADREQEILDEMLVRGGEFGYASQLLYSNIMELSRALQHNIVGSGKEMKNLIENAQIVEKVESSADTIVIGSRVKVLDIDEDSEEEYQIVGSQEANPMEGRISDDSPFGFALKGHKVGDTVTVEAPAGELQFKILSVEND